MCKISAAVAPVSNVTAEAPQVEHDLQIGSVEPADQAYGTIEIVPYDKQSAKQDPERA